MKTFWLYYNDDPIYSVRMPEGSTASEIRERAILQNKMVPLCFPIPPATFESKLWHSTVVEG